MKTKINNAIGVIPAKAGIYFVLLLSLFVRLINLNQSLWLDEAISVLAVKNNSFINLITKFSLGDFHPPLYYLILKLWTNFFGYSEISARFPSVIFGVLTVPFVYLIGKKLFNQKTGLVAATFFALNPLAIYYSQEARMYSLVTFALTAAVYFFIVKKYLLFSIFFLIALYTDYLPWLMIPVLLCHSGLSRIILFISIFLLPIFPLLFQQLPLGLQTATANPIWSSVVGGFNFKSLPLILVKFIFGRITIDNKIIYSAVFGSISLIYLWVLSEAKNKLLWLWLAVPVILGTVISFKIPVFSYFRFLFVLPAFVLLLAEGAKNRSFFIAFIIIISFVSIIIFNFNSKFQREDWRSAVKYIQNSGSKIFMPSLAQAAPLYYYGPGLIIRDRDTISIGSEKTIFLVRYVPEIFDPRDFLRRVLELSGYQKIEEKNFNSIIVGKYENRD